MGIRRNEWYDGENEDLFEFSFLRYKDIVMVSYMLWYAAIWSFE